MGVCGGLVEWRRVREGVSNVNVKKGFFMMWLTWGVQRAPKSESSFAFAARQRFIRADW